MLETVYGKRIKELSVNNKYCEVVFVGSEKKYRVKFDSIVFRSDDWHNPDEKKINLS